MIKTSVFRITLFFLVLFLIASSSYAGVWHRQYASTGGSLGNTYFTDSKVGYFANNSLFKTTDRGITWTAITSGTALYIASSVHYINNTLYSAGTTVPASGRIESSTDNGSTWTSVSPGDILYESIWFADQNNGIVTGGLWAGDFRHTVNGGTTWEAINLGIGETYKAHSTSTSNIWVTGTTGYAKWNGTAWSSSAITGSPSLRGVHAEDANLVFMSGDNGLNGCIFKTENGGANWTTVVLNTYATIKDVWFTSALEGWAVSNGGEIFYTSTGGGSPSSWTTQSSGSIGNALSVFFTDSNNGWALFSDGLYKYIVSPEVTSISPSSAAAGWTGDITITGTNFQGTTGTDKPTVAISGVTVNSVTYTSSTQITANITIPSTIVIGSKTVTVTNPDTGKTTSSFSVTASAGGSSSSSISIYNPQTGNTEFYAGGKYSSVEIRLNTAEATTEVTVTAPTGFTITANSANSDNTKIYCTVDIGSSVVAGTYSLTVTNNKYLWTSTVEAKVVAQPSAPSAAATVGIIYPAGKQYVNPDTQSTINATIVSSVADDNGKIIVAGSTGIFNIVAAAIKVGNNTISIPLKTGEGMGMPNGIWPIRVIAKNGITAKGKLVVFR
ncbi:MAG: hypothetical protein FD145_516 [Candidatus Saganbacteria bacterium]|uniref:IPT/TIG domain-containing protein n=1 Tax=Candidatus Saganbacteria bacterium TaxID=2575572 RepID=A0A833NYV6_UNCSA|nr:MAG: hypothetical protein FD145_516 [Candidatus Saganbacteria bacterium]